MDLVKKLTDEFAAFNACFNRRVAYFRALQSISDTVEPITLETKSVEDDMTKIAERLSTAKASFDKVNARRRYVSAFLLRYEVAFTDVVYSTIAARNYPQ